MKRTWSERWRAEPDPELISRLVLVGTILLVAAELYGAWWWAKRPGERWCLAVAAMLGVVSMGLQLLWLVRRNTRRRKLRPTKPSGLAAPVPPTRGTPPPNGRAGGPAKSNPEMVGARRSPTTWPFLGNGAQRGPALPKKTSTSQDPRYLRRGRGDGPRSGGGVG